MKLHGSSLMEESSTGLVKITVKILSFKRICYVIFLPVRFNLVSYSSLFDD